MKKIITLSLIIYMIFSASTADNVRAQNITNPDSVNQSSAENQGNSEEAQGKAIWDKLQAKQVSCGELTNSDFELIGDYSMGLMAGDYHEAMDQRMEQMMGRDNTEQMHIVMGKRWSGCDTSAAFPAQGIGFMPMMNMMFPYGSTGSSTGMMGGWSSPSGFNNKLNNSMMWGFGNNPMGIGFGLFGWVFMLLFWVLIIAGIIMLVKWFAGQSRDSHHEKSPLEILKERYAKGEINKKEFEEKTKDLKTG